MDLTDARPPEPGERDGTIVRLLQRLWSYSFTTKADEARNYADEIAEAASRGLITTEVVPGGCLYGRLWKLTPEGLRFLYQHSDILAEEEAAYVEHYCRPSGTLDGIPNEADCPD